MTTVASTSDASRPRRRDAQRNRDALLAAARDVFAEHGLEAPLEEVARRAGLAIGTLYRHFATRAELVRAIFAEKMRLWRDAAEQAAEMDDAWEGFWCFLETMCELQADDRGFNDLASIRLPTSSYFDEEQTHIAVLADRIVERAQRHGALRADVTAQDLVFVVWAHSRIIHATHGIAPGAWRRYLHLMLDGFRADRCHPLPEPPLTRDQLYQAMLRLGGADVRETPAK
ncbi:DNA-binding transcriptional regulator, AcrR family [Nonomuraea solani]|uniref:DNA-binding transcriptional regulator, AcrR family n=1 Tax=Nonomuraea solani TaxID=1144553 RepID=A0A1H6ER35_9ACTN|nr:TetR/AcrR family transcriptional regulator [Nonomuraea solani]SEH00262.1 DNA-binding transcriptional regulator, AcrR family [Nonomuraea solani]